MLEAGATYTVNKQVISPVVVERLRDTLSYLANQSIPLSPDDPPWEGGWEEVTKEGKITKRISKWMREKRGVKLDSYDLGKIGNCTSRLVIPAGTRIEVTDKFDWNPGDYSDNDSCFFRSRRQTWPLLHHLGAKAAKIFMPHRSPGRCLILESDGKPLLFNFYGLDFNEGLNVWKAALPATPIGAGASFRIDDSRDTPIYINHGAAHVVGDDTIDEVRLYASIKWDGQLYCEGCYKALAAAPIYDDTYGLYYGDPKYTSYVCQDCYEQLRESKQLKWTMAKLIPVPLKGKAPKKKKKAKDPEAGNIYTSGNTFTITLDGAGIPLRAGEPILLPAGTHVEWREDTIVPAAPAPPPRRRMTRAELQRIEREMAEAWRQQWIGRQTLMERLINAARPAYYGWTQNNEFHMAMEVERRRLPAAEQPEFSIFHERLDQWVAEGNGIYSGGPLNLDYFNRNGRLAYYAVDAFLVWMRQRQPAPISPIDVQQVATGMLREWVGTGTCDCDLCNQNRDSMIEWLVSPTGRSLIDLHIQQPEGIASLLHEYRRYMYMEEPQ